MLDDLISAEVRWLAHRVPVIEGRFCESSLFFWRVQLNIKPVTLEGKFIRLAPMALDHIEELCTAGLHKGIWRYMSTPMRNRDEMHDYVQTALQSWNAGTALPFVMIVREGNAVVGSTRYLNIEHTHRRVEIGSTWITPAWQRASVNSEAKYLMLCHAFDVLNCVRVEFKTDSQNVQSRKALDRIGAKEEGTLRNHMVMPDGRLRHSVYYSILDSEWVDVKVRLERIVYRRPQL